LKENHLFSVTRVSVNLVRQRKDLPQRKEKKKRTGPFTTDYRESQIMSRTVANGSTVQNIEMTTHVKYKKEKKMNTHACSSL